MLLFGWLRRLLLPRSWMLGLLILVVGGAMIGPAIAFRGPLKAQIIKQLAADLDAELVVDDLSVGWFEPVTFQGVRILDRGGEQLLEAERIVGDKRLFDLALNRNNLGSYEIHGLHVWLVAERETTNWEQALAPLLEKPSTGETRLAMHVSNGLLTVRDVEDAVGTDFELRDVLWSSLRPQPVFQGRCVVPSNVAPVAEGDGSAVSQEIAVRAEQQSTGWNIRLKSEEFPLTASLHLLRRATGGQVGAERLTADVAVDVRPASDAAAMTWQAIGTAALSQARVLPPASVSARPVAMNTLMAQGKLLGHAGGVTCEAVEVTLPFGNVTLEGDLSGAVPAGTTEFTGFRCEGEFLPVRLAEAAGWQIREEVPPAWFEERARFRVIRTPDASAVRWQMELESLTDKRPSSVPGSGAFQAASAVSSNDGWPLPVQLRLQLTEAESFRMDHLFCEMPGVTAAARRSEHDFEFRLQATLDTLRDRVARIVDLQNMHFTGTLTADGTVRELDDGLQLAAMAEVKGFQLTDQNGNSWQEDHVLLNVSGTGALGGGQEVAWREFSLTADAGQDRLTAWLREPAAVNPAADPATADLTTSTADGLHLAVSAGGSLARWLPRLWGGTTPLADSLDGVFQLECDLDLDDSVWNASKIRSRIRHWHWETDDWQWYDPQIDIIGDVSLIRSDGRINVPQLQVTGQTAAVMLKEGLLLPRDDRWHLIRGAGQFRGELSNLSRLIIFAGAPRRSGWSGRYDGNIDLQTEGGVSTYTVSAAIQTPQWTGEKVAANNGSGLRGLLSSATTGPTQRRWSTSEITADGIVRHDLAAGVLTLDDARLNTPTSSVGLTGTIGFGQDDRLVDRQASVPVRVAANYEISGNEFQELVAGLSGDLVALSGQYTGQADMQWSLTGDGTAGDRTAGAGTPDTAITAAARPVGSADIRWDAIGLAGLTIGAGQVKGSSDGQAFQIMPIDVPVNSGRLVVRPTIDVSRDPIVLTLAPGTLLDRVDLTSDVSRSWLRFVSPLLAESTDVHGMISVGLTNCSYPLGNAAAADIGGQLRFHEARMRPGATIGQIVSIVRQVEGIFSSGSGSPGTSDLVTIPPQDVEFKMTQGRVYHRNLTMLMGSTRVDTSGSVGIDQSLQMQIRIPVREEWKSKSRFLAGLPNDTIVIPVGGTLNQPRVDANVLGDLLRGSVGNATQKFLQDQLQNGLQKLLPGNR